VNKNAKRAIKKTKVANLNISLTKW